MVFRHAKPGDLASLVALYNHYIENTTVTFDLAPFSVAARAAWLAHYQPDTRHQLWVAEQGGRLLGYASSSEFKPKAAYASSVETSIYLQPDCCGQGLGGKLYRVLFDALAPSAVHRAYAAITQPNPESNRLHEKFGFEPMGVQSEAGYKFDRYWDVAWYEKKLDV